MDAGDKTDLNNTRKENAPVASDSQGLRSFEEQAVIKVCGIGGGGGNAVDRMIKEGLREAEFITINTDAQALKKSPASVRLQIGADITGGLGSGADPEIGRQSALQDKDRISEVLKGADMVFLTAGLGGGTGTGAAPIIAEIARESGALTVAIVTLPFYFEGPKRKANAYAGLAALEEHVDTLIVVPNDRVIEFSPEDMTVAEAFRQADEVLHDGVQSVTELIQLPGNINADFADVRTIMRARGRALIGIGVANPEQLEASGDRSQAADRAITAARAAIVCPLLEQSDITGATEVLVNIIGGQDMKIHEVDKAVSTVRNAAHPEANVIWGAVFGEEEEPELRVTVIAAGFVEPEEAPAHVESGEEAAPPETEAPTPVASTGPEPQEEPQEPAYSTEHARAAQEPAEAERGMAGAAAGSSPQFQAEQQKRDMDYPAYLRLREEQAGKEVVAPPPKRAPKQATAGHPQKPERRQKETPARPENPPRQEEAAPSSQDPPRQQEMVEPPTQRGRREEPAEDTRNHAAKEQAADAPRPEPQPGRKGRRKMAGFLTKLQQDEE